MSQSETVWDIRETDEVLRMSNNILPTQALFYEFGNKDALYTLKARDVQKDGKLYRSLYKLYMESVDEHEAALRFVGDLGHWRKLCSLSWFLDGAPHFSWEGLKQMREDMAARDKSLAKRQLLEAAQEGNVTAMKVVYGESPKQPVGRKAKERTPRLESSVESSIVANISKLRSNDG